MKKIGACIVISVFLYSQIVLAGASVLCVTQDGQTHLEPTDNHGHCLGEPDADCAAHINDNTILPDLCVAGSHCHDIPLSPSCVVVMSAKRFSKIMDCHSPLETNVLLDTMNRTFSLPGASIPLQDCLTSLRTVVLLI